nr:immunoglobulin-like domain-containing protein [Aeromonas sp. QDB22]
MLSNGETITIKDGETTGRVEVTVGADEDVYLDASSVSASITTATGGNFESLVVDKTAAVTQITDTISEVIATLTADKTTVSEGGEVTYTVTLTSKDGLSVSGQNGLTFTLDNGKTITIAAGQTSGSVTVTAGDDVYTGGQADLSAKLTGVSGDDSFEKLTLGKETVTTKVTDEPNGEGDKATVLLSGPASVVEGSVTAEYTVTLSHAAKPGDKVLLSYSYTTANGDDIVETKEAVIGVDGKTAKFTIATVNDVRIEGSENFAVSVSKVLNAAGQDVFEGLDTSAAKVTTTIVDNDSVVSLQAVVEGTTENLLNVADGVTFTGTTTLGGTVSLVDGKYVYQAPVRDHADSIADIDSFTYTKADGSTVTYTINILDTNPIAAKDSGSVAVGLNVQTSGSASLLANDTVVDSSSANPAKVYSVTGLNGQAMVLDASGSVTVAGKYGDLTVSADGSYTYTSKLDTDVQAVEGGAAVKSAFAVYGFQNNSLPLNGTSLNLTGLTDSATALVDVRTSGNNAKPGIGVSQSGGGTNDIGSGESLVIGLKALSNFAQIGINELNSGQGSASWKAYDANGVLVGFGTLVSSSSNGSLQSFNISTSTPFQYLVLGYSGSQNGYVIDSIKYTPAIGAVTEEFTYTVKDNDGDVSNPAVLTLNGNVPTTIAPTMLMGVEDLDVTLTWASFGISDNASTVRISGNQNGTGTIQYWDAKTHQYKELGKNETETFTKVDIDSGKVKFDPKDNVSGADVYGNHKGVGNKGHDLTSIKFDVLKENQVIASDKRVVVDLMPQADAPTLKVGTFSSLAAMDFETVQLGNDTWKDNINPNSINGAGAIGQWKANGSGLIEVGKESVYLGNLAASTTNQVMEIESSRNVSQLYTDIQCESGRFYQLNFDISARTTPQYIDISSCGLKVFLVQLDANGRPMPDSRIDLYKFEPQSVGWLKGVPVSLNVPETGTYRLVFESLDASGGGDSYGAVLDNVKFQAVDNKGYEDSFIKLGKIEAELVDRDDSERLSVEIDELPVGAVLKDAANHSVIVGDSRKVDVTGWSLSTLQLKVNDPGHYNLVVKATATEVTSSGTVLDRAVSEVILPVEVLPEGNTIKMGELNDSVYLSSDRPSVAAHTALEINGIHYSQPGTYQDGTAGVVIKKDSADTVYTYGGNDHVEGGRGNDVVYLGDSGSNLVDINSAINFVTADVANITQQPAAGVAREDGDLNSAKASVAWGDVAQGAQGNDFLFGEDGVDLLFGGSGNDHLDGGKDQDFIRGGTGDDVIVGGAGSDYLRGDEGADTFLWQQGDDALVQGSDNSNMLPTHPVDYITDFQVKHGDGWQWSSNMDNLFKDVDIARSDKLDLSDLLDHSGNNNESDLATLLSVFEKEGDVHLQVKTADGRNVRQEIVLLDSTFESITGDISNHVFGSPESTSQQVINYMLQNHLLDIDK